MSTPRTYQRPMPAAWFLQRPNYIKFMVRELTSVFVALYLVFLLFFLGRGLAAGPEAFAECLASLAGPLWRIFHVVVLVAAVFHAVTWFNLTPKAMPMQIGEERVADGMVAFAMGYAPWIVVTAVILWATWVS